MTAQPALDFDEPEPAAAPPGPGTELVPRATIEQIVRFRNHALELFAEAHTAIARADEAVKEAREWVAHACFGRRGVNNYSHENEVEIQRFYKAIQFVDRPEYLRVARQITDLQVWAALIEYTELEHLMDHEAKEQLRKQMRYVPQKPGRPNELITGQEIEKGLPEITEENIYATMQGLRAQQDDIFVRGIANAFSALDRRYRSNGGIKYGHRDRGKGAKTGGRAVINYALDHTMAGMIYG